MVPDVVYICNIMVTIFQYPGCDVYTMTGESGKSEKKDSDNSAGGSFTVGTVSCYFRIFRTERRAVRLRQHAAFGKMRGNPEYHIRKTLGEYGGGECGNVF